MAYLLPLQLSVLPLSMTIRTGDAVNVIGYSKTETGYISSLRENEIIISPMLEGYLAGAPVIINNAVIGLVNKTSAPHTYAITARNVRYLLGNLYMR